MRKSPVIFQFRITPSSAKKKQQKKKQPKKDNAVINKVLSGFSVLCDGTTV